MIRRVILALCLAACCAGASEVYDLAITLASALADNNPDTFEKALAKDMQGRERLLSAVRALLAQAETSSSIVQQQEDLEAERQTAVVEWTILLKRRGDDVPSEQRRETVTIVAVREGKRWKVASITPSSLFAPARFSADR